MILRVKLGPFSVCVTWLLCPKNLRSHEAPLLWWNCVFYNYLCFAQCGNTVHGWIKVAQKSGIRMNFECMIQMPTTATPPLHSIKKQVIFSSIMANAFFIEMRFHRGEDVLAVHLLCTTHWRWARSSFPAPILVGMFWRLLSNVGVLRHGAFFKTKCTKPAWQFLWTLIFTLTRKKGQGTDDLTLL